MRIWLSLIVALMVMGMSQTAQAQNPVGVGPPTQFSGVGLGMNTNANFFNPNVNSVISNPNRPNIGSTGLIQRVSNMSFFKTQYTGYNVPQNYPDMGLSYLQGFGYRVAQPAVAPSQGWWHGFWPF